MFHPPNMVLPVQSIVLVREICLENTPPQIEHYIWILNSKKTSFSLLKDCIDGVMVSTLSGIDLGFKPRSCQSKDYKIGICRFFT